MAKMTRTRVAPAEDYDETSPAGSDSETQDESDSNPHAAPEMKRSGIRRPSGPVSSGWGAPQQKRETVKAPYLKVDRTKKIIKLLDAEPSVRFKQHYLKTLNKFYTCIEVYEGKDHPDNVDCPLCDAGHKASVKFIMNVIEMDPDATAYEVKTWTFGPEVAGHLQDIGEDLQDNDRIPDNAKTIDAERWYFKVYQVKADNNRISNKVEKISASLLPDEFGMEPLNTDEILELGKVRYGDETVWITSEDKLREAAKSL